MPRQPGPQPQCRALAPGPQAARDLLLAQLAHQVGQGDLHRTDDAALVAHRRRVRQVEGVLDADEQRRQHRAHRARIHPAVGVAADGLVHRAVVHAGGAADAAQHVLELAAEQADAAIVDQDEIEMLGAVRVLRPLHAGEHGEVIGYRLPGGGARQDAHQRGEVFQGRDHLLHAGDDDMHSGQRRHHAAVALVGDQRHGAGFGDEEVAAGDAHVRREEVLAQHLARLARHFADLGLARLAMHAREQVGHLLLGLVDDRGDDVRGRLVVVDLQDVLAEVGFHRLHAGRFQRGVEPRLLGEHRLRLDGLLHVVPARNFSHQAADLRAVARPQHLAAAPRRFLLEALQPQVKVLDGAVADRLRGIARRFEIDLGHRAPPPVDEEPLGRGQLALQHAVGRRRAGACLEVHGAD